MSERTADFFERIINMIKKTVGAKDDDYVAVVITVLIGEKKDVVEAENMIKVVQDLLPCKNAVVTMSGWRGNPLNKEA